LNTRYKNELISFTNCLTPRKHQQESMHFGATFSTPRVFTPAFLTVLSFQLPRFQSLSHILAKASVNSYHYRQSRWVVTQSLSHFRAQMVLRCSCECS